MMSRMEQRWTPWRRCGGALHGYVARQQQRSCTWETGREPTDVQRTTPLPVDVIQGKVTAVCNVRDCCVAGPS